MKKVLLLIVSLVFCGSIFAQYESHWPDVNFHMYEDHDPFVAMVALDNHIMVPEDNYEAFEVAAFVGENYRGHGFMIHYADYNDPNPILEFEIFYQPIEDCTEEEPNPEETPQPVIFKLYDHSTGTLYEYWTCTEDIVTQTPYNSYNFNTMPVLSFFHTFTKEINPYTEDGGWYLISSPVGQVNPTEVENMTSNTFDLYYFDQNPENGLEWINIRNGNTPLEPTMGYLYANSGDETGEPITLTFIGAPYDGEGEVTLIKEEGENAEFSGWNLVGNPFAQTAYIDRSEFYVMNSDGTEIIAGEGDTIPAMEGVFVVAAEANEKVTFSTIEPNTSKGQIVLNVTNNNRGNAIDRAIVRFGEGGTLPKFMLNPNNTKLYIAKDNKDFAVVRTNNSGRLPVNFEPAEDGVYFINASVENLVGVRYLHLIDHEAGLDIDLLQEPIYKFDAKKNGKPGRFELVFKKISSQFKEVSASNGNSFGFCNNGNWIINNEGDAVLQVIDVNGRILCNEEINGSVSKRIDAAPGVYMLRLINNNDVKVQKIVVE